MIAEDEQARLRTAHHEASHVVMAALFGRRIDTVSTRRGRHFEGITVVRGGRSVDEIAFILGSRSGDIVLAQHGVLPVPLYDQEELRGAGEEIMIYLAGPIGAAMLTPRVSGRVADFVDHSTERADEQAASSVASSLTDAQREHLLELENGDAGKTDEEVADQTASHIAGESAGAYVQWMTWETRRLVGSALFRSLVTLVAEQLLRHVVLSGDPVHDLLRETVPLPLVPEVAPAWAAARREATLVALRKTSTEITPDTPIADVRVCHRDIIDSKWGRCNAGQTFHKDHPIVVNVPEAFEPLFGRPVS